MKNFTTEKNLRFYFKRNSEQKTKEQPDLPIVNRDEPELETQSVPQSKEAIFNQNEERNIENIEISNRSAKEKDKDEEKYENNSFIKAIDAIRKASQAHKKVKKLLDHRLNSEP